MRSRTERRAAHGPGPSAREWRVPLPPAVRPPFQVFVNGVLQEEGRDYRVEGAELRFVKPLRRERVGFWRWTLMFFSIAGTYGREDSVDVRYEAGGEPRVATGLDVLPPKQDPAA